MTNIKFQIGDEREVIRQLFHLYAADPVTALKEYISNAIDARENGASMGVSVYINRRNHSVIIQDSGMGMSHDKLASLPISLGNSSSRYDRTKRGEKALGLLAFGGFGERAYVISRQQGDEQYSSLYLDRKKLKAEIQLESEEKITEHRGEAFDHGTRVIVFGVDPATIEHYFKPDKLRSSLRDMYNPLLQRGELALRVGWQGKPVKDVEESKRKGQKLLDDIIETVPIIPIKGSDPIPGHLFRYVYVNGEGSADKIGLYNKGVRVLGSVSQLKEFNHFPWNSGKLSGTIDDDFTELIPSRDGYMRDEKFAVLCDLLKGMEPELGERVRDAESRSKNKRLAGTVGRLEDALGQTYRNCPAPWSRNGTSTTTSTATGTKTPPKTPDGSKIICRPPRKKRKGPDSPYTIGICEFPLEFQHLRGRFDPTYEAILLNRGHDDFTRHTQGRIDDNEAMIYFAKLVSEGAAFGDWLLSRADQGAIAQATELPDIGERASEVFINMMRQFGVFKKD
jgi:hypothetical protein